MNEEKLNKLVEEVDAINTINERIVSIASDHNLTDNQLEELRERVWETC